MLIDKNYEDLNKLDKKQFRLEWSLRDYRLMPAFNPKFVEINKQKYSKCLSKYLKFMRMNFRFDEAIKFVDYLNQVA